VANLRGQVSGSRGAGEDARRAWQESMTRRLQELRAQIEPEDPIRLAIRSGGVWAESEIRFRYWGQELAVSWPSLEASQLESRKPCSTFDTAMLLYYLVKADGAALAGRWIGFRELPDGAFYNQAFQGYSGGPLARALSTRPAEFERAAAGLDGTPVADLAPHAFRFLPLPRLPLAAALWPGDEDLPGRAAILFDASASHYLTTDGLALLGSGLASRLMRGADVH